MSVMVGCPVLPVKLELLSRGSVLDMMDVMMGTGREDREKLQ